MTDIDITADELRRAKRAKPEPYVRVRNEEFLAATAAEQRVIIARDVLEWVRVRKLEPWSGTYLSVKETETVEGDGREPTLPLGSVSTVNGGSCYACGLGALFALTVERGPFEVRDVCSGGGSISEGMRHKLAPYFSPEQLTLIECAFERSTGFSYEDENLPYAERLDAAGFGRRVEAASSGCLEEGDSVDRRVMRAIMQNIIDNNGTFIP